MGRAVSAGPVCAGSSFGLAVSPRSDCSPHPVFRRSTLKAVVLLYSSYRCVFFAFIKWVIEAEEGIGADRSLLELSRLKVVLFERSRCGFVPMFEDSSLLAGCCGSCGPSSAAGLVRRLSWGFAAGEQQCGEHTRILQQHPLCL